MRTAEGDRIAGTRTSTAAATSVGSAIALARAMYLDDAHAYGCAESVYVVLKSAYGLDDPMDASAAMALNGGIAWSGGPCGALTGAAVAVGMLAGRRIDDHGRAKRVARGLVANALEAFRDEFGSLDCRTLTGHDLRAPGGHEAFLASGAWRQGCLHQIGSVVGRLAALADPAAWERAVAEVETPPAESDAPAHRAAR